MPPQTISVSRFKATCLRLIEEIRQTGEPLVITKRGVPVAQIGPPPPDEVPGTWLGCMRGSVEILGDIEAPAVEPAEWEALRS